MPIEHAIWTVGDEPRQLREHTLAKEQQLEDMIVRAPSLLSEEWMLIGRQEDTGHGGRVDLLAIAPDGCLVLIELKRDRTPREVIAQALDYAAWVENLKPGDLVTIYGRFVPGRDLAGDLHARFGRAFDEDEINASHQIVIVAATLDARTERIVAYLAQRDIPINVLFFRVFSHGTETLLSRAWLRDPVESQASVTVATKGATEPWNGEFYCSFGHGPERSWEDAVEFGFICAGGGTWYTQTLALLRPGDRIWTKVPGQGFVGVGRVTGPVQLAREFEVNTPQGPRAVLDVATRAQYFREQAEDLDACEHFVPVRWLQTVPLEGAVQDLGMFGNQNTVCRPRTPQWRATVERLKAKFPGFDRA